MFNRNNLTKIAHALRAAPKGEVAQISTPNRKAGGGMSKFICNHRND